MVGKGQRYRAVESIPIRVWWERDTVAILDDYSEWCHSELPAGESFEILDVEDSVRKSATCRVERESELRDLLIPRKRQNRILCFRLPTPYFIEIKLDQFGPYCEGPLTSSCT